MLQSVIDIARKVLDGGLIGRAEAEQLVAVGGDDIHDLFYWANKIRIAFRGNTVTFCAIVAAKVGGCSEDCSFCSQSAHHDGPAKKQAKLTDQEVLDSAAYAGEVGADSFGIVNSGRGPTRRELEGWLKPLMMKIAREGKTRACATLGALTPEAAKYLYDCGIRRINHNLETSERHYPSIVSTHPYSERVQTLKIAKEAGLSLCSGGIFGMGENWNDRLDMMFALRELEVDVMPINFLNPIHGTPLGESEKLPPLECLKIIAIARFLLPNQELKVAGGRETCLRDLQSWMFFAGADSTMIGNYLTTYGRAPALDHQMIKDLGLTWRGYDGGGVEPVANPILGPETARLEQSGKHGIPILYEREVAVTQHV